jgi:hypothetical protein
MTLLVADHTQFAVVRHATSSPCLSFHVPEALRTPSPLLNRTDAAIVATFIVGTNGRVESFLILRSGGRAQDRVITETVSKWRYRPGTCDGAPVETETRVSFSVR